MTRLIFTLCIMLACNPNAFSQGQEKYAVILSKIPLTKDNERTVARNNFSLMQKAFRVQGYKEKNILFDTADLSRKQFYTLFGSLENQLRPGDFVMIYADLPVTVKTYEDSTWDRGFELNNSTDGFVGALELLDHLSVISKKLNTPDMFLAIYDSDWPAFTQDFAKKKRPTGVNNLNIISIRSGEMGEHSMVKKDTSIFTKAVAATLTSGSSFITNPENFCYNIKRLVLLATTQQTPVFEISRDSKLFNANFKKFPVHFSVIAQGDDSLMINAGTALMFNSGRRVRFFKAFNDTTNSTFLGEGVISSISTLSAAVKPAKKINLPKDSIWAYVTEDKNAWSGLALQFNTSYTGGHKAEFNKLLTTLRSWHSAARYLEFVNKGGDLSIGNLELQGKDSLKLTVVHPVSGLIYRSLTLPATLTTIDELEDQIIKHAQYQYLSRIRNYIPELSVRTSLETAEKKSVVQENGFTVFYEGTEAKFKLVNTGSVPLYYGIIDMQPDMLINIVVPEEGHHPMDYRLSPSDSIALDLTLYPPFGIERLKIFTSMEPVHLSGFRQYNRFSSTRGNTEVFRIPEINIQNVEFEIRSRAYAKTQIKLSPEVVVKKGTGNKQIYTVKNPSEDRIYFNLLKQQTDGSYKTILPGTGTATQNYYVNKKDSSSFAVTGSVVDNDLLVTVYADRPFNINDHVTPDRQLNELLLEILKNGKLGGTALNKICLLHNIFENKEVATTRDGNKLSIRLITPKVSNERGLSIKARSSTFELAGMAYTDDKKPVRSMKINGDTINFDRDLGLFEVSVSLVNGNNKIVIEAFDEKGFSVSRILNLELEQAANEVTSSTGKNYFLGIGIEHYNKGWDQLYNATKDVLDVSTLLSNKFGFEKTNIILLLDAAATRKNIIDTLRYYLTKVGPNDNVIIYLSGHGNLDPIADGDYYFIPQESGPGDVSSAVSSSDIVNKFIKIQGRHCILIVDACYSGMLKNAFNDDRAKVLSKDANKSVQNLSSKWILSSGIDTPVSDGQPGKNSPFAAMLLNYLNEHNAPADLEIGKVIHYLEETVPKIAKQKPEGERVSGRGVMIFQKQ